MKPAPFDLYVPTSLAEATALLAELGDDAKPLAGGQSLVPLMNFRLARPTALIDLRSVPELQGMTIDRDGQLCCGALVRQRRLEHDPAARGGWAILGDAIPLIGHVAIRNRGTIGGSLAHADPAAELPAVCMALGAEFVAASTSGRRTIPVDDFFDTVFTTALEPDELLVEVKLPAVPARTGDAWSEFARRHGDFAVVGVAARVTIARDGTCASAALVLAGAASTPLRVTQLGNAAQGAHPGQELWEELANIAATAASPPEDAHGDAKFRRRLVRVIAQRALATAAERATEQRERE